MASYIDPIEPMSQLSLEIGGSPKPRPEKMRVMDEEAAKMFREKLETEKEARRVLGEMKRDQAIEKAREFVREGKSAFSQKSGGGAGGEMGFGIQKLNKNLNKNFKKGGKVKVSSASKRADGCAIRGKTKGKMC